LEESLVAGGELEESFEARNLKMDLKGEASSSEVVSTTFNKKDAKRKSHFLMGTAASTMKKSEKKTTLEKPRCQSAGTKRRPTQPISPKFKAQSRASRANETKVSSEEMEALQIAEERKKQEMMMKKHQKLFQALKSKGVIPTTVRSTKELTIPVTPYSNVETRLTLRDGYRPPVSAREAAAIKEKEVADKAKATAAVKHGPTQPLPFKLSTDARAKVRGDGHELSKSVKVETAGEMAQRFQNDSRSHEVPAAHVKVTIPVAPTFHKTMASSREKPLSYEEIEALEMEEAKKHTFKAKPVNHKIFDSMGEYGVPKVAIKQNTQPEEFNLLSNRRASYRASHSQEGSLSASGGLRSGDDTASSSFKARPMPSFTSDPRASIRRGDSKVTEAHSPKLSGGARASSAPARRQRLSHAEAEQKRKVEAQKWKELAKRQLSLTEPEGFQLQTTQRGYASEGAMKARLQKQMEDEKKMSEVHARPFPEKIFKQAFVPEIAEKPLTEVEEFHLATTERHMKALEKMQEAMKENQVHVSQFHAKPVPQSTYKPTMKVEPSNRVPLQPQSVNLHSNQRAAQRKEFDSSIAKAAAELARQKEEDDIRKAAEEKKAIKLLRKRSIDEGGMQFKAAPVMSTDPYPCRHVEPPQLTEPHAPHFRTAERANRGASVGSQ
jgi:hypothetical protein